MTLSGEEEVRLRGVLSTLPLQVTDSRRPGIKPLKLQEFVMDLMKPSKKSYNGWPRKGHLASKYPEHFVGPRCYIYARSALNLIHPKQLGIPVWVWAHYLDRKSVV